MNKKLLIGIIVVAVLITGGYFASRKIAVVPITNEPQQSFGVIDGTPVDASAWLTYRNEKFGFEMQVPTDTVVKQEWNDSANKLVYLEYEKGKYFEVRLNSVNGRSLDEHFFYTNSYLSHMETTLAGQRAVTFHEILHGEGGAKIPESVTVATEHNGYFYDVTFFDIGELSSSEKKVLATFRFTK